MPKFLFEIVDPKGRNRKVSVEALTVKQATELLGSKGLEIVRHIEPEPVIAVQTDPEPLTPKQPPPYAPPDQGRQSIDVRLVSIQVPFRDVFDFTFKATIAAFLTGLVLAVVFYFIVFVLVGMIGMSSGGRPPF